MKRGVLDRGRVRQLARPSVPSENLPTPDVGACVRLGELGERERLPDPPAQLVRHRVHVAKEAAVQPGLTRQRLETPVSLLPFLAGVLEDRSHGRAY